MIRKTRLTTQDSGLKAQKGQSILEYVLLVVAVLLAVIYGANTVIKGRVKDQMETAGNILGKARTNLETAVGLP